MIAVFYKYEQDFQDIRFTPKGMFVKVRKVHDICGRKFTGVMCLYRWSDSKEAVDAMNLLQGRQPELFQ